MRDGNVGRRTLNLVDVPDLDGGHGHATALVAFPERAH